MRVIVVGNQKGGVGKTTTVVSVAHGLTLRGKHVLIVDCDSQGQAATFLGLEQGPAMFNLLDPNNEQALSELTQPAHSSTRRRPHLDIVPGGKRTRTAEIALTSDGYQVDRLALAIEDSDYDYILIDTGPSVGLLQEAAIYAADWLLVPVATNVPAIEGLNGILATLAAMRRRGSRCELLGVLPTMYDDRLVEARASLDDLSRQRPGREAMLPPIHRAAVFDKCAAHGETIWEFDAGSRAAEEYAAVVWRVLEHDQDFT